MPFRMLSLSKVSPRALAFCITYNFELFLKCLHDHIGNPGYIALYKYFLFNIKKGPVNPIFLLKVLIKTTVKSTD